MTEVAEVKTIGDVERLVHGSGLWDGTGPVEFSNDGERWVEAWAPSEANPHPEFARVAVHRKDVTVPKRKTIRWDDYVPKGEGERSIYWLGKWTANPSRHFDRITRMVNYREMFRDILGDIVIEGEDVDNEAAPGAASATAVERDWRAEFDAATDMDALDAIVKEARAARIFTPTPEGTALDIAWKDRRRALLADWTPAKDAWEPTPEATQPEPLRRPAPQDHLPGNRAQRRAKKRGRR